MGLAICLLTWYSWPKMGMVCLLTGNLLLPKSVKLPEHVGRSGWRSTHDGACSVIAHLIWLPCHALDSIMWNSILAISFGSAFGALLRWFLGTKLNSFFPTIPPGTLTANLVGGYIIGLAIAFFATAPDIAPAWRLLIITGFCGGLTTFSTFSAEVVTLLQQGRVTWALAAIATHVCGSLLMTLAGVVSWQWLQLR